MRNIRLVIQYDGSRYAGFQKLGPNGKGITVEDKLNEVLSKMADEEIQVVGAAKLEAGVHAMEQIANFKTNSKMKEYEMKHYLNQYLPRDIAVVQVDDVPERFHSSLNAKSFRFRYRITMGEVANVFERKYTFYSFRRLDVGRMKEAAKYLVGKQDFKTFAGNKKMKKSTIREIYAIDIKSGIDDVTISIHGDDFWPFMARKIVGLLYKVGLQEIEPVDVTTLIEEKDPSACDHMAEAQGLFLDEVYYQ